VRRAILLALVLAGCGYRTKGPKLVFNQHPPYNALPQYLAKPPPKARLMATREVASDLPPCTPPPLSRTERYDRLRALLAAIDAHVASLGDEPTDQQQRLLRASVDELRQLLVAWPDVAPEGEELAQRVEDLSATLPIRQPELRKRIGQLTDLIRVQITLGAQ
jgi:hypothetical protein